MINNSNLLKSIYILKLDIYNPYSDEFVFEEKDIANIKKITKKLNKLEIEINKIYNK